MADINLLSNNKPKLDFAHQGAGILAKILIGVLILVLLYYGYLRLQISRTAKNIQTIQAKTTQLTAEALTRKDRNEVITRQGQLQNIDTLIKSHVYWSGLLPELARVTLKSASYASFKADVSGTLNLDVIVPTYADADKYIQVFDLPQFNQQFSDVKILSIGKTENGTNLLTQMKLQLKFNPSFIHKTLQ